MAGVRKPVSNHRRPGASDNTDRASDVRPMCGEPAKRGANRSSEPASEQRDTDSSKLDSDRKHRDGNCSGRVYGLVKRLRDVWIEPASFARKGFLENVLAATGNQRIPGGRRGTLAAGNGSVCGAIWHTDRGEKTVREGNPGERRWLQWGKHDSPVSVDDVK